MEQTCLYCNYHFSLCECNTQARKVYLKERIAKHRAWIKEQYAKGVTASNTIDETFDAIENLQKEIKRIDRENAQEAVQEPETTKDVEVSETVQQALELNLEVYTVEECEENAKELGKLFPFCIGLTYMTK